MAWPAGASALTSIEVTNTGDPATAGTCPSATNCTLRAALLAAAGDSGDVEVDLSPNTTYTVVHGSLGDPTHAGGTVTLQGFTGTVVDLSGSGAQYFLYDQHGLALADLTISGLSTSDGVVNATGSLSLSSVTFSDNTAFAEVDASGTLVANGVTLTNDTDSYAGIHSTGGTAGSPSSLDYVTITGESGAGSVYVQGGTIGVNHVVVNGGNASVQAVDLRPAATTAITGIYVQGVSGAALAIESPMAIDNVSLVGNTAKYAAAFVATNGVVQGRNWTLVNNTNTTTSGANQGGGGLTVAGGTVDLGFATIAGNNAEGDGDEVHVLNHDVLHLGDSIVDGTNAGGAIECVADAGATIVSTGYNIDRTGQCGLHGTGDQNGVDPLLGAQTHTTYGAYEPLGYGSPAVDAVPIANCSVATDIAFNMRPQGTGCDSGSYESPLTAFSLGLTGAPGTALKGAAVTYTVTAANSSQTVPQHAVITDVLPAGATLSSANIVVGTGAPQACSGTTTITCAAGALHRGENAVATVTAVLNTAGANTNTAAVTSELPDVNDSLGSAHATTIVSAPGGGQLTLSGLSIVPAKFRAATGGRIHFTATAAGLVRGMITGIKPGVKEHGKCVAPPRKRRLGLHSCPRSVTVRTFSLVVHAGANSDQLSGHGLAPGAYRLTIGTLTGRFTVLAPTKHKR